MKIQSIEVNKNFSADCIIAVDLTLPENVSSITMHVVIISNLLNYVATN